MTKAKVEITAEDKTKAAVASAKKGLKKLAGAAFNLKTALAGAAGVAGFGALTLASARNINVQAKLADKIGITTENLKGLQAATDFYTSAGAGAMAEALTKATKRLGEFNATGGGAAAQWLKRLALDTQELAKLEPDELFNSYAEAIGELNNRGEQLAATSALMGDESRALIGVIDAGSGAVQQLTQDMIDYGVALNRVDSAKVEAANDSLTLTKKVVEGLGNSLAVEGAPFITAIANEFAAASKASGGFRDIVKEAFDVAITGAGLVADATRWVVRGFVGIKATVLSVVSTVVSSFEAWNNAIADTLSLLPGVDIPQLKPLTEVATVLRNQLLETNEELVKLADAPMPSEKIKEWASTARTEAQSVAEAVAAAVGGKKEGETGGKSNEKEIAAQEAALANLNAFLAQKVVSIQDFNSTVEEREIAKFELDSLRLEEARARDIITEEDYRETLASLEEGHQDRLSDIQDKARKRKERLDAATAKRALGAASGALKAIASAQNTESKKGFERAKKANKVAVVIDTYQSAVAAF